MVLKSFTTGAMLGSLSPAVRFCIEVFHYGGAIFVCCLRRYGFVLKSFITGSDVGSASPAVRFCIKGFYYGGAIFARRHRRYDFVSKSFTTESGFRSSSSTVFCFLLLEGFIMGSVFRSSSPSVWFCMEVLYYVG